MRHLGPPSPLAPLVAALAFAATTLAGEAVPPAGTDAQKSTTSAAARREAIDSIPVQRLTPPARAKVKWVLENTSVFRRLPLRVVVCDADLYCFLTQHPDVVVNIWEALGVAHISMRQTGPDTYQVNDEAGTSGMLQFLYRSRDTQIVYIDGQYNGRVFGHRVHGRGVLVLNSGFVRDVEGRCFVSSRMDAFMNIEPGSAEFLTKTFQPLVGKVADFNFIQAADFLGSLSRSAEVHPRGMQRLANRLEKIQPEVRQQFAQVARQVSERAGKSGRGVAAHEGGEPAGKTVNQEGPRVAQRTAGAPAAPVTTPSSQPTP